MWPQDWYQYEHDPTGLEMYKYNVYTSKQVDHAKKKSTVVKKYFIFTKYFIFKQKNKMIYLWNVTYAIFYASEIWIVLFSQTWTHTIYINIFKVKNDRKKGGGVIANITYFGTFSNM